MDADAAWSGFDAQRAVEGVDAIVEVDECDRFGGGVDVDDELLSMAGERSSPNEASAVLGPVR